MAIISPVHTGLIGGQPVRFFADQRTGQFLPWHSVDDLHRAMPLPPEVRTLLLKRTLDFSEGEFVTVDTPDGKVIIGPHSMAISVIGAAVALHRLAASFEGHYLKAETAALEAIVATLRPAERIQWALSAALNSAVDEDIGASPADGAVGRPPIDPEPTTH